MALIYFFKSLHCSSTALLSNLLPSNNILNIKNSQQVYVIVLNIAFCKEIIFYKVSSVSICVIVYSITLLITWNYRTKAFYIYTNHLPVQSKAGMLHDAWFNIPINISCNILKAFDIERFSINANFIL